MEAETGKKYDRGRKIQEIGVPNVDHGSQKNKNLERLLRASQSLGRDVARALLTEIPFC